MTTAEVVFRVALYGADGALVRTSAAFLFEKPPNPQTVADPRARAADTGYTYEAGTFLVWIDPEIQPHEGIEQTPQADGSRSFGPPNPGCAPPSDTGQLTGQTRGLRPPGPVTATCSTEPTRPCWRAHPPARRDRPGRPAGSGNCKAWLGEGS